MADLKISQLSELQQVASNDKFAIVDTSANQTKYVQMLYLLTGATKIIAYDDYQGYADVRVPVGATDFHTYINSLFTSLSAAGGGTIFNRAGTFVASGKITPKSNVYCYGEGDATVWKQADNANVASTLVEITQDSCKLFYLKVDGNYTNNTTQGRGVTIADASKCTLEGINIVNTRSHALNIRKNTGTCSYNLINKCYSTMSTANSNVIISGGASYNEVVNSFSFGSLQTGNTGFYVTGTVGTLLDSNGNKFIGCYAENCDYGFDIFSSTDCHMIGCHALGSLRDTFHFENAQDVSYSSCFAINSGRDGFGIYGSDQSPRLPSNISFNNCQSKGAVGVALNIIGQVISAVNYPIKYVNINGGNLTESGSYGIRTRYTQGITIGGGVIVEGNGSDGVRIDTSTTGVNIGRSTIANNVGAPIRLVDSTVDNVDIVRPTMLNNGNSNAVANGGATNVRTV